MPSFCARRCPLRHANLETATVAVAGLPPIRTILVDRARRLTTVVLECVTIKFSWTRALKLAFRHALPVGVVSPAAVFHGERLTARESGGTLDVEMVYGVGTVRCRKETASGTHSSLDDMRDAGIAVTAVASKHARADENEQQRYRSSLLHRVIRPRGRRTGKRSLMPSERSPCGPALQCVTAVHDPPSVSPPS